MNAISEIPHLFTSCWVASFGVPDGRIVTLIVMSALIGMMSNGKPDDPTDL